MTRTRKITINVAALVTAVLAAGSWFVRSGAPSAAAAAVNQHWVLTDSFRVFQQDLERQRIADSNSVRADIKDIRGIVFHLDSSSRCDHGHREFCP